MSRAQVFAENGGLVMQANLFKHLFYSLPAVVNTQRGKTQRVVMQKRRGSMFLALFFLRTEHGQAFFFSLLPKRDKRHKSLFGKCSSNALRKKKRTSTKKTYLKNASTEGTCRPVALWTGALLDCTFLPPPVPPICEISVSTRPDAWPGANRSPFEGASSCAVCVFVCVDRRLHIAEACRFSCCRSVAVTSQGRKARTRFYSPFYTHRVATRSKNLHKLFPMPIQQHQRRREEKWKKSSPPKNQANTKSLMVLNHDQKPLTQIMNAYEHLWVFCERIIAKFHNYNFLGLLTSWVLKLLRYF